MGHVLELGSSLLSDNPRDEYSTQNEALIEIKELGEAPKKRKIGGV